MRASRNPGLRSGTIQSLLSLRTGVAVLAGLMLALSFPTFDISILAWLGPGCLLLAGLGANGRHAFGFGYLGGLVHHLVSLHWLLYIPFPAGAIAGWLALSAYLALYPATWVWLCTTVLIRSRAPHLDTAPSTSVPGEARLRSSPLRLPTPPSTPNGDSRCPQHSSPVEDANPESARPTGHAVTLVPLVDLTWYQRTVWCLACAAAWVALEMLVGRFLTGFPWNFLGVSQYQTLPLIQIASFAGVHGVSFIVAWCSVALLCAIACVARRLVRRAPIASPSPTATFRVTLASDLALPLFAVVAMTVYGGTRLVTPQRAESELRVAVVQPSIPQRLIFDPQESTNRFNRIMELTRLALATGPDLLVWPEASLPSFEEEHYRALTNLIASHRIWMVFGAEDVEVNREARGEPEYRYFNSAFLFDTNGQFAATYRKRRLVIFGEYIPLERWLPFTKYLTPIDASITPGTGPVWFQLGRTGARVGPLICFEDVFASSARDAVDGDTDFLLNLTNNGWFGESAAQWQQAANAAFRAVENGVPLLRCTNNGLTCWIDAFGRLRDVGFNGPKDVYGPGFKVFRIPLLSPAARRGPTFYQRHGDLFGWSCAAITVGAIARARVRSRILREDCSRGRRTARIQAGEFHSSW
ncbi:MAG: Apolipoprotein N-acyltransferase [Verrucomicrobia bacterium ADurb.Bin006]|nr:MAG: Apolipoprotein N-acyltransferase [Verrucomicrobia bacterium ADurb.Bin006]